MKGKVGQSVLRVGGPILALRYRRAALRDENNGLPFTAAMEWRKAAELSSWITLLADRYWREWERIMNLPRCLADPIGLVPTAALQPNSPCRWELALRRVGHPRVSLQPAA